VLLKNKCCPSAMTGTFKVAAKKCISIFIGFLMEKAEEI